MAVQRNSPCVALLGALTVSFLLGGCGGGGGDGGGGGGGGNGASFLTLTANMVYGSSGPGGTSTVPYPTDPAGGVPVPAGSPATSYQVAQPVFSAGAVGTQTFLELSFNRTVRASSIISNPPSGSDGIVLFVTANGSDVTPPCLLSPGAPVCMKLDVNGVLNPSNVVVGDVAPATIRLYYDPDDNLLTPDALPAADYSIVITSNLRTPDGGTFCVGNGSSSCINWYLPAMPFTIGSNTTPLALAATPIVPVQGETAAPIHSEITINFVDSVDFPSVVGGQGNLTTLDPFVSIPFTLGGMPPQPNIIVTYTPPTDPVTMVQQTLPPNLGFILYMPDPKLNPTQVRIRFVDLTNLQPANNPPVTFQNYASNPLKYPIQSSDPMQGGADLQLPAIRSVPGSVLASNNTIAPATVMVTVTALVTDRANIPGGVGNPLAAPFVSSYSYTLGPTLARNPVPPDATFVGSLQGGPPPLDKPGVTVVDTANTTGMNNPNAPPCNNVPAWTGVAVTGVLTLLPANDRIADLSVLGTPGDLEVGTFLNPNGVITDSPRGTLVPGVLDDQNGLAPSGILNCLGTGGASPAPLPPYGNRLYVTDLTAGALKVFNSYDFSLIAVIPGVASPRGLGIAPDLSYLYVSNELQGTVQRINANPASPQFHTITNTVTVGAGPRAISVMPGNEDAIVCNFAENSISFIRTSTQTERARFTTGLGPSDVFVTNRMSGLGLTNEYMAFIPCTFGNSLSVYESAGGSVFENVPDGRMIASLGGFLGPSRGTWNWQSYVTLGPSGLAGPGCFVANTTGSDVTLTFMNSFTLSPPPGFGGPPGTRTFVTSPVATGFQGPSDVSIDNMSGLYNFNFVGLTNNKRFCDPSQGGGIPSVLVVSYPGLGKCVAYDYNSPAMLSEVAVPGCDFLQAYYDQ